MGKDKPKPTIIFIVPDALRARNLSCYGYHRKTSPNIDELAKNGVLFENAFTCSNLSDRALMAILGSRHLISQGKMDFLLKRDEIETFLETGGKFIQEILKEHGYKTYRLLPSSGWRKSGFDFTYESKDKKKDHVQDLTSFIKEIPVVSTIAKFMFYYVLPTMITDKIRLRHGGPRSTNDAIRLIKEKKDGESLFMYIGYCDTHIPYKALDGFSNKFKAEKKSENFWKELSKKNFSKERMDFYKTIIDRRDSILDVIAKYDCAIAYDDHLIGKVIKALEEKGILDDTIILFFSDHGESLDEQDIYFDHGDGLYDASIHVPFIIRAKGLPKGKRMKAFIQLEEIIPTVLDLAGIEYGPLDFDGMSLLPLINGEADKIRDFIFAEEAYQHRNYAIRDSNYKYIEAPSKEEAICKKCRVVHGGVVELYDLEKDPGETKNIASENKDIVMQMSLKLDRVIRDIKSLNEKRKINKLITRL